MSTRIGIISDIHSSIKPLESAFQIFNSVGVDKIICAGDIAGYGQDELEEAITLLMKNNCLLISGNHDDISENHYLLQKPEKTLSVLKNLPKSLKLEIEGKSIYVVHASPPQNQHGGIKLLDQHGEIIEQQLYFWQTELSEFSCNLLIVGHTHQVFAENIGETLVVNPGSTLFNHSCMIITVPEMTVETYALNNKPIVKSWNWGVLFSELLTGQVP